MAASAFFLRCTTLHHCAVSIQASMDDLSFDAIKTVERKRKGKPIPCEISRLEPAL
jgi:hypothetical protein